MSGAGSERCGPERWNHLIRRVDVASGQTTTLAGSVPGFRDGEAHQAGPIARGPGPAARGPGPGARPGGRSFPRNLNLRVARPGRRMRRSCTAAGILVNYEQAVRLS